MTIKNGDIVNLAIYQEDDLSNRTVIITEDITNITLTSNRKPCDFRVFVKKRNSDLNINIDNLILNSQDEVAINFASGKYHDYKSYLKFSGVNTISSKSNIGICITNNQTVEIKGEKDSFLKVSGGSGVPVIGSSFYTEGAGNVVFSGEGSIEILAGNGDNRGEVEKTLGSGCGIGFYNEKINDISSIRVLDNINLKIVGEDGIDIQSISQDKIAGKGGNGVEIKNNGIFEKKGNGLLEISGGNGGILIGDYSSGVCGDGGCTISFGQGEINIDNNTLLRAGHGGSIKDEDEFPMVKGGNGGDIISLLNTNLGGISKIRIGNEVEVNLGNGGNSGSFIDGKDVKGFDGGDSGSLINSKDAVVKAEIGDINIKAPIGGLGGNKSDKSNKGKNGKIAKKYLGNNIELIEFKEKIEDEENLLEDMEKLQSGENSEIDKEIKEEFEECDVNDNEIGKNHEQLEKDEEIIGNLEESIKDIINEDLEPKDTTAIEENIIDIEKNGNNLEVLEETKGSEKDNNYIENKDLESSTKENISENEDLKENSDGFDKDKDLDSNDSEEVNRQSDDEEIRESTEEKTEETYKKSIWERIKRFFKGEN
ncbi:MAG: hypothetical protein Q4B63_08430 [Clostridium perfringens]|nr:hypothetical protein [Clostridium perfringens]